MEDFNVSPILVEDLQAITYENNFISIGYNSLGYFFINKSGKRISIYFDDIQYDPAGVFILKLNSVYGLANIFGDIILKPHYLTIDNFSENVARVQERNYWGFIDIDGNLIVKPKYNSVGNFQNGLAEVTRALLPMRSNVVSCLINKHGQAILNKNQLQVYSDFCFITNEGDVLAGIKHDSSSLISGWTNVYYIPDNQITSNIVFGGPNIFFYNEYLEKWRTTYDLDTELYGMISRDGKIIIPCVFKSILERKHHLVGEVPSIQTTVSTKLEIDKDGWSSFVLNESNKQELSLACKSLTDGSWCFDDYRILKNSNIFHQCIELKIDDSKYLYCVEYNGKFGVVDSNCSPVIPMLYDEIVIPAAYWLNRENVISEWFRYKGEERFHPCANSREIFKDFAILCRKNNEWCIYKCHGGEVNLAVEEKFAEIHLYDHETFLVKHRESYGVFYNDALVVPCLYDNILLKNEKTQYNQLISSIIKVQRNEYVGFYYWNYSNPEKNSYVEPAYKDIYVAGEGVIVKSHNDKMGIIDLSGREIIPVGVDTIEYVPATQSYILSCNGFYGIVNSEGNTLVPIRFSRIEPLGSAYICTNDTIKMFYSGDCATSFEMEELLLIDTIESIDGKLVTGEEKHTNNPNLQYINKTYDIEDKGLYVVISDSQVGVVNKSGNIIVPICFQRVGLVSSNLILAFDGKKMILYSLDGSTRSEYYDDIIEVPKYLNSSFKFESRYEYPAFYVKRDLKVGILSFYDEEFHIEYPCIFDELSLGSTSYSDRIYIGNKFISEEILGPYGNKIKKSEKFIWCSDFNYKGLAVAADYAGNFWIVNDNFRPIEDLKCSSIIEIDPLHYILVGEMDSSENLFNSANDSCIQSYMVKYDKRHKVILNSYAYRVVTKISCDLYIVQQDGLYGVVKYSAEDEQFGLLMDITYDEIRYDALTIIVKKDGLYGCYNLNGECVLDIQYSSIESFDGDDTKFMLTQDLHRFKLRYPRHLLEAKGENGKRCIYNGLSNQCQIFDVNTCLDVCYFNKDSDKEDFILKAHNQKGIQFFSLCLRMKSEIYTSVEFHENNRHSQSGCSVKINDRYGYIDFETFDLIPCRYAQRISYLEQSHRFWKFESKDQIYDSHLNRMLNIPLLHDIAQYERNTMKVYVYENTNSVNGYNRYSPKNVGLYDSSMECIIPAEYDDITIGLENQFIATSNFTYDEYQLMDDIHGWRKCKECSIYNKDGEKLFTCENRISFKTDMHNQKYYLIEGTPSLVSINGREFYDLVHGHVVKEFVSDHCSHYYSGTNHDGSKNLKSSFGKEYYNVEAIQVIDEISILKIRGRYIAISKEKELTPASHYRIFVNTSRKYITLMDYYKRVFIDYEGNYIGQIEGKFCNLLVDKSSGVITAISKNDSGMEEYRLYSLDGTLINSTVFSFIGTFSEGYATCVINSEEKLDREFFKNSQSEFFFYYNRNNYGKWGIINSKGEIVIPMKYDFIRAVKEGKATYLENLKYGILNIHTRTVTSAEFDFLHHFSEGLCIFKEFFRTRWSTESKCGFIDEEGRVRIPAIYKTATPFKSGRSKVTSFDGYVNMIDINGSHLQNWELPHTTYEPDEDDGWSGYSASELDEMYRDAMGGDPANQWNID